MDRYPSRPLLRRLRSAHCAFLHRFLWTKGCFLFGVLLGAVLPTHAQHSLRSTQRTFEPRIMLGLELLGQWPNLVGHTGNAAGIPFIGLGFDVGGSLTYRDRLSLTLQANFVGQGFLLCSNGDCLDIFHLTQRFEARASWMLYGTEVDGNALRVGLGWGLSVQNRYDDIFEYGDSEFRFSETTQARPYLVPEVGVVSGSGRRRTEYALRYVVHLDRTPAWTVQATNAGGGATFTATDDHVAFAIRWYFGFRKKTPPVLPQPRIDQQARNVDRLDTINTRRDRLVLRLSDNAEYDGDTVSVLLNGKPVLVGHELTHRPRRVVLYLERRVNTLTVLAHNEGRVPPNTALCTVRTGRGRQRLLLRTGLRTTQEVVLRRTTGRTP